MGVAVSWCSKIRSMSKEKHLMSVLGKAEIQFQLMFSHQLNKATIKNFGKDIYLWLCE